MMFNPIKTSSEGIQFAFNMTEAIEALSSRLELEAQPGASRDITGTHIQSEETVRYLEKFTREIADLIKLAVQPAGLTQEIAKKITAVAIRKNSHSSRITTLSDRIRTLAETSDQRARNIRDVGYGIQRKIQHAVHDLKKLDKTLFLEPDKIKFITSTLKNILFGMVYIVNDLRAIGANTRDVLRDAEACLNALKRSSEILLYEPLV